MPNEEEMLKIMQAEMEMMQQQQAGGAPMPPMM